MNDLSDSLQITNDLDRTVVVVVVSCDNAKAHKMIIDDDWRWLWFVDSPISNTKFVEFVIKNQKFKKYSYKLN